MNLPDPVKSESKRSSLVKVRCMPFMALIVFAGLGTMTPSIATLRAETTSASGAVAITSIPCVISAPGTYYLAADLTLTTDTAYGISITVPNVTLDLNGHTLSQVLGTNNSTIGIYCSADDVTVRNGTVAGCLYGVYQYAHNGCFEDLFVMASTYNGMAIYGSNNTVRHCRVNNIGGTTVPNLAPYAVGIGLFGSYSSVIDCDVTTLTPGPGAYTICVIVSVQGALIVNNRFSAANKGTECYGATGKYRDNIAVDINYPYNASPTPLTDAGNNN